MKTWIIGFICLSCLAYPLEADSGAVFSNQPRYLAKRAFAQPGFNSEMVMETVGQFMTYIRDGKIEDAYYKSTSKTYRALTSWETFWCFVNQYPNFTSNLSIEMESVTFKDGYALFTAFLLNTENKKEFYFEVHAEMENNTWKIMGLKVVYLKAQETKNQG